MSVVIYFSHNMRNLLETAKGLLAPLLSRSTKGDSVLGVDFGSSSIKIVQMRKERGVAVLETYGELALGPYAELEIGRATNLPAEKLSTVLTDLIAEANVTAKIAGVAIPFSASLTSLIQVPDLPQRQLQSLIPIEARKYIPVPLSEVTLDWFVVPKNESKYLAKDGEMAPQAEDGKEDVSKLDVLLVAIHNDVLNKYQAVMENTKRIVEFYEIEIFSTIRAVLGQGVAPVMVLDMGAASTKAYMVEFGIVRASHIINRGGQDITLALSQSLGMTVAKAEELKREVGLFDDPTNPAMKESILLTLDNIFSEANRVLLNYQGRFNKSVSNVILAGGTAAMNGILDEAKKHFETEVTVSDPFAKVESPAFLDDVLKGVGPEFAVAVGVALRKLQTDN
ncbi:MAG: pilus assembly protein PilM [Parcubacteria group bacterium]|nr:pilus assembly protein PilM [Parcubacteria group bacterium]